MKKRPLCGEVLEARTLLAGEFSQVVPAADTGTETAIVSDDGHVGATDFRPLPIDHYHPAVPPFSAEDLLVARDGQVFTVRNNPEFDAPLVPPLHNIDWHPDYRDSIISPGDKLFVFDQTSDGDLEVRGSVDLDFHATRLLVTDEVIILLGVPTGAQVEPTTTVVTFGRANLARLSEIELAGPLASVAMADQQLFLTTLDQVSDDDSRTQFLHHYKVTVFELGDDGPRRIAQGPTHGVVQTENLIPGGFVISETVNHYHRQSPHDDDPIFDCVYSPWERQTSLVRYAINEDSVVETHSLDLELNKEVQFQVSEDQSTLVALQSPHLGRDASMQSVLIIDLGDGGLQERATIPIGESDADWYWHKRLFATDETVVLSESSDAVLIIDLSREPSLDPDSRVSRIELPSKPNHAVTAILPGADPDHFHLLRSEMWRAGLTPATTELVTLSLSDNGVAGVTEVEGEVELTRLDDVENGYVLRRSFREDFRGPQITKYSIGSFDADGKFVVDQSEIEAEHWIESDATETHLILRTRDQLTMYRWDAADPPAMIPLGDPLQSVVAVDDTFEVLTNLSGVRRFSVLTNDLVAHLHYPSTAPRVVELVGAPEGVSLERNQIVLSESAAQSLEDLQFEYVVQFAGQQSTASVHVKKLTFTEADVQEAIERARQNLAERLELDAESIDIVQSTSSLATKLPHRVDGDINPLAGEYGVIVDLRVDEIIYRYAADLDGNVARMGEQSSGPQMAIRLAAVDADGTAIDNIDVGDEFYLIVTARDLRPFGGGVFGVAFDLEVPVEILEFTGEIEDLERFDTLGGTVNARQIDEWRGIDGRFTPPGNSTQSIVRIGVRAVGQGTARIQLEPAESRQSELLLHGFDERVSVLRTEFGSTTLTVQSDAIREDTDGNGTVTPSDALRVINFVAAHGSMHVAETTVDAEGESVTPRTMHRLDVNNDGRINARDILKIINHIASQENRPTNPVPLSDILNDERDEQSHDLALDDLTR